MVRHVVNYLAAADIAAAVRVDGPLVDVGCGVGSLGAWLAARLGRPLHLVDHDTDVRAVAAAAFPSATVHADVEAAPRAAVVTAMEVLEHVEPPDQAPFVGALVDLLAPGGVLVVSTPDESGYPGGWSGYPPHVGPVTFSTLAHLLEDTGQPAMVWRITGPGFTLSRTGRLLHPVGNRIWGWLAANSPRLTHRLEAAAGRASRLRPHRLQPLPPDVFHVDQDPQGPGTGLIGVVWRPSTQHRQVAPRDRITAPPRHPADRS